MTAEQDAMCKAVGEALKKISEATDRKLATRDRQIIALKSRLSRLENLLINKGAEK